MLATEPLTKANLLEAYREGCEVTRPEWNQMLYFQTLGDLIALHSGVAVAKAWSHFSVETQEGLEAARRGELETAKAILDIGEGLLSNLPRDRVALLLAQSGFLAKRSYIYYKYAQYNEATKDFAEAYRLALTVERELGFGIILLNRLQLLSNYARMQLRRGDWRKAFNICCLALSYIESPDENSALTNLEEPWGEGWNYSIKYLPSAPASYLHYSTAEIALSALDCADAVGSREEVVSNASGQAKGASVETQVSLWLALEHLRTTGTKDCHPNILALLRRGSTPSEPFWHSSVEYVNGLFPGFLETTASS